MGVDGDLQGRRVVQLIHIHEAILNSTEPQDSWSGKVHKRLIGVLSESALVRPVISGQVVPPLSKKVMNQIHAVSGRNGQPVSGEMCQSVEKNRTQLLVGSFHVQIRF